MKRLFFFSFICSLFISVATRAQSNAQNGTAVSVSISGSVVSADTTVLKRAVSASDTSVVFLTSEGDKYYLLADKKKMAVFQKLVTHRKSPMKISGFSEEINRSQYIIVESFIFL